MADRQNPTAAEVDAAIAAVESRRAALETELTKFAERGDVARARIPELERKVAELEDRVSDAEIEGTTSDALLEETNSAFGRLRIEKLTAAKCEKRCEELREQLQDTAGELQTLLADKLVETELRDLIEQYNTLAEQLGDVLKQMLPKFLQIPEPQRLSRFHALRRNGSRWEETTWWSQNLQLPVICEAGQHPDPASLDVDTQGHVLTHYRHESELGKNGLSV